MDISDSGEVTNYYGHAEQLFAPDYLASIGDVDGSLFVDNIDALLANPNQPEADDERIEPNGTAQSPAAEISYIVRNGKLYRRVLLLRNPPPRAGSPQPSINVHGGVANPDNLFDLDGNPATPWYLRYSQAAGGIVPSANFWGDFDLSAFRQFSGGEWSSAKVHGLEALNNAKGDPAVSTAFPLGDPAYRFGHNTFPVDPGGSPNLMYGMPREFTIFPGGATSPEFFGRFLHEETSFEATTGGVGAFRYPQGDCITSTGSTTNGHPMDMAGTPLSLDPEREVIEQFVDPAGRGGSRRSEELLLAGVHEFRVEIWDDRLGKFVSPGHSESTLGAGSQAGDYHISRRLNPGYGPLGPFETAAFANRVFDTWHPNPSVAGTAPVRAMTFYPPRVSDTPPGPSPDTMPGPFVPMPASSPANHP